MSKIFFTFLFFACGVAHAYDDKQKLLTVGGSYVFAQESYKLDGQGFAANTGSVEGRGFAATVRWYRPESRWAFEYVQVGIEPSSPASLTPAKIEADLKRYLITFQPRSGDGLGGGGQGLLLDYGLEIRQRRADTTTPNPYMPSHDSTGFRFGLEYLFTLGVKTTIETGAGLYVPLYLDERGTKTGYYKFSVNPDVKAALVHEIADYLAVSAGFSVLYEQIFYSGTGDRGTADASESFLNVHLPLELRFQF